MLLLKIVNIELSLILQEFFSDKTEKNRNQSTDTYRMNTLYVLPLHLYLSFNL
jgi:hypothetical protein